MTDLQALKILFAYQIWRRSDHEPCDFEYSSQELGVAINIAALALLNKIEKKTEDESSKL